MSFHPFFPSLLLLLPFAGFVANGALALVSGRRGADAVRAGEAYDPVGEDPRPATHTLPTWIGPGVLGLAFLVATVNFVRMLGTNLEEPVIRTYWTWLTTGSFEVSAAIQLDQLSAVMMMVVTGVGFLIHVFSVGYMRDDEGYPRYFAFLNLFIFFMLILVLGSSYPLMFVGWEGVGLCSYLLIGFWFSEKANADAGKKAFIVNRIGDFGFLVAMFLLFRTFGTLDFQAIMGAAPDRLAYGGGLVTAVGLFLLLGATGKSAQIPLYTWLPDAMAGPTPVSALIHAATMVTAGVYMVARSGVLYSLAPVASTVVAGIGVATAFYAATIAVAQYDIKKVLAYSTISQLGYMFLGVGVGAYAAGIFHLMAHAFFKALLFLGAGAIIHSMHHAFHYTHSEWDAQDMRNMGGLRKKLPVTWLTMWAATLAISGIWPFAGFFSKDEIIWEAGRAAGGTYGFVFAVYWVLALAAAALTVIYMTRLMVLTFHGENRTGEEARKHLHEAPWVMTVPLVVLGLLSLFGGWINVSETLRNSILGGFGILPMTDWLHHWLEPVTATATSIRTAHMGALGESSPVGGGEFGWSLGSTVGALIVLLATVRVVRGWTVVPATESAEPTGLRRLLYRKYYVDEIYDRIVVQPLMALSRFAWRIVDQGIIDGIVNAAGHLTRAVGWFGSLFETGQVNTYAFVFTLGVLFVLGVALLR